jgi:uncharacterized protein (DUF488 family)
MFHRQKIVLHLLGAAERPVTHLELTKWCFLLKHESESRGGPAFYQFLPYQYGPFSFVLYREIQDLIDRGLVETADDKSWRLGSGTKVEDYVPPKDAANDARLLAKRLRNWNLNDLINDVYDRYPSWTVNSIRSPRGSRKIADIEIFTAGYEGLQVDGFLNLLVEQGIQRLIDVRNNPISRQYGFHKSTLNRICSSLGIEYVHIPQLGIASRYRTDLNNQEDYDRLFEMYESDILPTETAAVERATELIRERPSVLVCMEGAPRCCHRSRLAETIACKTRLPVSHLEAAR